MRNIACVTLMGRMPVHAREALGYFTVSNTRRFHSSRQSLPLGGKGLNADIESEV